MLKLNDNEVLFIGLVLEGLLYGLYSGLFAIFLHHGDKKQNIVFYSICALYALSVVLFALDLMLPIYQDVSKSVDSVFRVILAQPTLFGVCDFIAQFILIYRCWIVWGRNIRVVIIPSILTFAFLVVWLVGGSVTYISSGEPTIPLWGYLMTLSGLAISLTVNALVTGLIVFKILKVFRQVRVTSNGQNLGSTGGSKLRHTILVLIESGMVLFSVQLVRLVVSIASGDSSDFQAFEIVTSIHDMLTGITPTIIAVRISMGLSFHDEKSMEEVAMSFVSNHPNSVMQMGSITIQVDQDNRDDDIDVQKSNKISSIS